MCDDQGITAGGGWGVADEVGSARDILSREGGYEGGSGGGPQKWLTTNRFAILALRDAPGLWHLASGIDPALRLPALVR